jgi:hypothetical protein
MSRTFFTWPAIAAIILAGLVGCKTTVTETETEETAPGTTTQSDDWQKVDSGCGFFFEAPPEMQQQPVTGIDSCVGQYQGAGMQLTYDYGGFSDPLEGYSDSPEYKEESATIDGFQAKVISLRRDDDSERPYAVAVHFPDIGKGGVKLTMSIKCEGPAEMDDARLIVKSITFP